MLHHVQFVKKYKRLPDENTFRELIMKYDATDTAWAEVFKTDDLQ